MIMKRLAAAMLLAGISHTIYADEPFVVQDIQVDGLQRVALGAALNNIPFSVGDSVTEYTLSRSIKTLFSAGHFDDIRVLRDGDRVIFRLKERPTINNIEFDGNKDIKDDQLNESLAAQRIQVGEPLDRTILRSIENGLTEFYHGVGKYQASVEVELIYLPRNRVNVKINFDEGDAASVRQINIVGNEIFDNDTLLSVFESRQDMPRWRFWSSDRYQKQTLQGDFERVQSYYLDRGYLRFSIDSSQVSVSPDKSSVYVTMNVTEGEQYKVRGVRFAGDLIGQDALIERVVPIKPGELYNGALVTFTEETIGRILARFGYANSRVTTIPDIDDENKEVELTINVDPGKRIYVRRIDIAGNANTKDEVFRRELRQLEGGWLSNDALELSKNRIQRLPYVERIEFETRDVPGVEDQVDITFNVREQPSGSFNAGISYGDFQGLAFQIGVEQSNFMGSGNSAGINLNTNKYQRTVSLNYNNPYFTLDGVSLGGQLFYTKTDYSSLSSNLEAYRQTRYGVGASMGIPINEFNRLNFGGSISVNDLSLLQNYDQLRHFKNVLLDGNDPDGRLKYVNYELTAGWVQSTLNRGLFPTAGHYFGLNGRISTPNSDLQFFKTNFEARKYIPLSRDHSWTFMSKLELGYGNGYGSRNGYDYTLPFNENFTAGGYNIRGFEHRIIGPRAVFRLPTNIPGLPDPIGGGSGNLPGDPSTDRYSVSQRSIGGNAMAVATLELITPTPFVGEDSRNSVRTSIFVDAGNVWDTEFDFNRYANLTQQRQFEREPLLADYSDPTMIRVSTGVSLQWISPMGPLTFSLARILRKYEGDLQENFSFNIGATF
ncbi:outer membrane protein assembly factor BamA [Alkalimonas delamerensis]|uniref:Outer membrane protein assembly factor BamA n=1 Tax=Alkalimonas delamerensis TaxID=265981 RepID=A0ABT9GM28_9GAMM|nr:outer membrane protein assembly factor BamA [Alkalimonas delamerensis]MDP4528030.1 outer membrane protein assembly factor BamA [Alkalimonas delamerensis]